MALVDSPRTAHEQWSSRFGFLMAAIGSAIGLGNFWKFPYEAGENGGGAFVLVYLLCVVFIALPVLWAELVIGRHGKLSGPGSFGAIAKERGQSSSAWAMAGWLAVLATFLILSFYSVIAGWILYYIFNAASGAFVGASNDEIGAIFDSLLASPVKLTIVHAVFMAFTTFIVARGIRGGIEWSVKFLMPIFIVLMIGIVAYSLIEGDAEEAARFLFTVDFTKITFKVAIEAIGHAFFSVGVGAALMITYGAYLDDSVNLPVSGVIIAGADTLIAILAGFAIFPIVFAVGLSPASGPGLLFVTLPSAFGAMPYGSLVGTLFFILGFVAALTSSIAIMEVVVSRLEETKVLGRAKWASIAGFACFLFGILTVLSFNVLSDFHPFNAIPLLEGKTVFDTVDFLASNVLLPLGGIFAAVFVGWVMTREEVRAELGLSDGPVFKFWRFLVRWACPIAVFLVLLGFFGVFNWLNGLLASLS